MDFFSIIFWSIIFVLVVTIAREIITSKNEKKKVKEKQNWFASQGYTITKQINNLCIDENKHKWAFIGVNIIFDYTDIIDFKVIEDGKTYKSQNGILKAVTDGTTLGVADTVAETSTARQVATVNKMDLIVTTKKRAASVLTIRLILLPTQTNSVSYSSVCQIARETTAQLAIMKDKGERTQALDEVSASITKKAVKSTNKSIVKKFATYTKVVGVTKNNDEGQPIQTILPTLDECDSLTFVREPNNPYDSNAIKVICEYQHIGYIKADLAKNLAPLMDSGRKLTGYICEITGGNGYTYGCNIHIGI